MGRIDKSLLEQMKINDAEIISRKKLLYLADDALDLLLQCKPIIEDHIDEIVDIFYEKQTAVDEISLLIGDADTLARLRNAQRNYIIDLFSGVYDENYVNNRLRIGMVHKRIGVEPKLYLSAVLSLKELIVNVLISEIKNIDKSRDTIAALEKLIFFDTTLVFDTYIDNLVQEIENAKKRTEKYAIDLEEQVAERTRRLERLAKLDPLTGLYNQREMKIILKRELALGKRRQSHVSLAYFDVDNFKGINDKLGHIYGDEVLSNLGQIILNNIRRTDIGCRYGGDEFCVVFLDCEIKNASNICNTIIKDFERKYNNLTLSVGISTSCPEYPKNDNQILKDADENMYKSKNTNGSNVSV
ncbi:MAG: GGDEF domain-containing protein [Alphaproteobacteria bacterium]|nr:GGDEF domain-containing protein [Alphaproteobacteria bacterium]HPF47628.1 GGDEF domain-containing protein [Emcibacteraceae bacterium]HRW28529.1 GGDEF domain-containing protein [Emcibacteraceae bacterium]